MIAESKFILERASPRAFEINMAAEIRVLRSHARFFPSSSREPRNLLRAPSQRNQSLFPGRRGNQILFKIAVSKIFKFFLFFFSRPNASAKSAAARST